MPTTVYVATVAEMYRNGDAAAYTEFLVTLTS